MHFVLVLSTISCKVCQLPDCDDKESKLVVFTKASQTKYWRSSTAGKYHTVFKLIFLEVL